MGIRVLEDAPGFVEETRGGNAIIKPAYMVADLWQHPIYRTYNRATVSNKSVKFIPGLGTLLEQDEETGFVIWPAYASGLDDMLSRSIARGSMANVGQTPVVDTYASTVVAKIQQMVRTWTNRVRGKTFPVKRTLDIMSRADDSQFGSAEFVGNFMGALLVDNRGAIGSQVPFGEIDFSKWDEYGMEAEKITGTKSTEELYVLRMTQEDFRENRGLWTIDGLRCYPTGSSEYPYWYMAEKQKGKKPVWVLIHRDFGWQILSPVGGKDSRWPGFGQSGAWRYSPYEAKGMAIDQMEMEHLMSQPMRGIVWVAGLDTPTQFRDQLRAFQEERGEENVRFYPGVFFGGSRNEKASISMLPWSEPPAGWTPELWIKQKIDALAASFHISSTQLQVRLGEGALTQSDVAAAMEAETAVAYWRHAVETIWNYIAPPRVVVTTIWLSDRNKRTQTETARELALAIQRVNPRGEGGSAEDPAFTNEQIRLLFKEFVGIPVPEAEEDDISVDDRKTGDDVPERLRGIPFSTLYALAYHLPSLPQADVQDLEQYTVGTLVLLKDTGEPARITRWNGITEWVWVETSSGYEMLIREGRLAYLPVEEKKTSAAPMKNGCNCGGEHAHNFRHLHGDAPPHLATYPQFMPEGDPLPYPEEVDIDYDDAIAAADVLYGKVVPEFLEGNWIWDDDERLWVNEDNGETMTHEEMVEVRDAIADGADELYADWPLEEGEEEPAEDDGRDNLIVLLLLGLITLTEWERRMRTAIRDAVMAQWLLGRGGEELLEDEDFVRLDALLLTQYQFLNVFSQEIATGTLSEEWIAWQAGLYFSDTVRAMEHARAGAFSYDLSLPCYPGDCTSECCANDRCYWSITDFADEVEARWVRTVSESCPTCIRRDACPAIVMDKLTGEHSNINCYL